MEKEKFYFDRYAFMFWTLIVLLSILVLRVFYITTVQGSYYRDLSDNKRIKEIIVTAPRGNIYDRNGVLLAGTKPTFTVQLFKDEINRMTAEERNPLLYKLATYLETDGANYIADFPIDMNRFVYATNDIYLTEPTIPSEKVLDIIINNNLVYEMLKITYTSEIDSNSSFLMLNRALNALHLKGYDVPIKVSFSGDLQVTFEEGDALSNFLTKHNLESTTDPVQLVANIINKDKSVLRKLMDHPISRAAVYKLLEEKNLLGNIQMVMYANVYDYEFIENKAELHQKYPSITIESEAVDDFVTIVTGSTLKSLLERVEFSEKNQIIVPVKELISLLEAKGVDVDIAYDIDESNLQKPTVSIRYKDANKSYDELPMNYLIRIAVENNVLKDFVLSAKILPIAQEINIEEGINPQFSITENDYVFVKEKNDLLEKYDLEKDASGEKVYQAMKEKFEIGDYDPYEVYSMLTIYDRLDKQGHMGYQPLNIAYGVNQLTVAKIEENIPNNKGIQISSEPVRNYTYGSLASHVLGYIGKIAQPYEIEEYITKLGYSTGALIGKTGIEESQESSLKGNDGVKLVKVDNLGNRTETLSEVEAVPGKNVFLTIDYRLQKVAEEALVQTLNQLQSGGSYSSKWGTHELRRNDATGAVFSNATSGATVVVNVNTGEILAMAVIPSFDPNLFATGISDSDWLSLFPEDDRDPLAPRPLYNIAMQTAIQPGSTFKLATALTALEKGLDPNEQIECTGFMTIGDTTFGCWIWNLQRGMHGYESMYEALRDSCNYYFYALALGRNQSTDQPVSVKLEIEDIIATAQKIGFGEETGIEINIPAENRGEVPNKAVKVETTKAMLRIFLNNNIRKYAKENVKLAESDWVEIINTIIGWVGESDQLSRDEVINRLDQMQLKAEEPLTGEKEGLADKIIYSYLNQASWDISDTLNAVIGQGQNSYTPLQMVNYMSVFANGGYRNKLTLIDSIKSYDNESVLFKNQTSSKRIAISDYNHLKSINEGLILAAYDGSNKAVFDTLPVKVGIKTGTAQKSGLNPVTGAVYDDYSWMIGFAPADNPEIAIATVIFQGGSGSNSGPLTRDIMGAYLEFYHPELFGQSTTPANPTKEATPTQGGEEITDEEDVE